MLLPLHIASLANDHIEIVLRLRIGDGPIVAGRIDWQIAIFDDVSLSKAIHVPILLCVIFYLLSVIKF